MTLVTNVAFESFAHSFFYCKKINPLLILPLVKGLISSSGSSGGDESDPESSHSGDSAFSDDINKMVRRIMIDYLNFT